MGSYTLKIEHIEGEFGPIGAPSEEEAVRTLIRDAASKYPSTKWKITVTTPPGGTFEATVVNVKDIAGGNANETEVAISKVD